MRERRKALTPEARRAASEIICAKLAADTDIALREDKGQNLLIHQH